MVTSATKKIVGDPGFVHLRAHSAYSLLEGALHLNRLIDLAVADDQPALGLCDSRNMFGALEFSEKARSAGVQPIIGCKIYPDFAFLNPTKEPLSLSTKKQHFEDEGALVLIAMDRVGLDRLTALVSNSFLHAPDVTKPRVNFADIDTEDVNGLICLTGGIDGVLSHLIRHNDTDGAQSVFAHLHRLFGDRLYVELQRYGFKDEGFIEAQLIDLAYNCDVPLVATSESFFAQSEDYEAHDALLAIAQGTVIAQTARRKLTPNHAFKTRQDMMALFSDLPEALAHSVEIAKRVHIYPQTRAPIFPRFAASEEMDELEAVDEEADALEKLAREGLKQRFQSSAIAQEYSKQDYWDRLDYELGVIRRMRYPGYFLIVADFIQWSKAHNIPVGPGRGSGAGSLVAYALTITDIDPLKYALLFERFLNPDRVSMPDFDIDFCQERRDEVIHYVQQKYGEDQVAQIITFGSLQARAVLRDVGRVMQLPYGQVDKIAKLVPNNPSHPVKLGEAIETEAELTKLQRDDEEVAQLLSISLRLEGLFRHASTHAAGIVIGDRPLMHLLPLYKDPRSDMMVTQYNMKWAEAAGLVKFDFLGLKTLTLIQKAQDMINRRMPQDKPFDIVQIPLDDKKTYALYAAGQTFGVFQVESAGMRAALVDLKPDRFEDIIALVALYRPGPMDNIPTYCARKAGKEKPNYLDDTLEPVLKETFGIIVYQEQVMQIAQILSGYTLGEADLLRRAMGKKIKAEMDQQRLRFVEGAQKNGLSARKAGDIFDLVAKFANYGFNKAHATAYALVSYQTCYLKANYLVEFLAASMTLDMGNTDKLAEYRQEAQILNIEVHPACVNRSFMAFDVADGAILYGLGAIKGVGQTLAQAIVDERGQKPFKSLADFFTRVPIKYFSKRTLETLIYAGAFDCFGYRREQLIASIDAIMATAQRAMHDKDQGIQDMFAQDHSVDVSLSSTYELLNPAELLQKEFDVIGFYLKGHPLDAYQALVKAHKITCWAEASADITHKPKTVRLLALLSSFKQRYTRKGAPMGILNLSDSSGQFELVAFSEVLERCAHLLKDVDEPLILTVKVEDRGGMASGMLLNVEKISNLKAAHHSFLSVYIEDVSAVEHLKRALHKKGRSRVQLCMPVMSKGENNVASYNETVIDLGQSFHLDPHIVEGIKAIQGVLRTENQ